MGIFIIARCEKLESDKKIERIKYLFKINGHLAGKYVRIANLFSINKLSIGEDYLLYVKIREISLEVIFGEIVSAKEIYNIKRDIL